MTRLPSGDISGSNTDGKTRAVQTLDRKRKDKFSFFWAKIILKVAQLTLKSLSAPLMALGGGLSPSPPERY